MGYPCKEKSYQITTAQIGTKSVVK